MQNRGKEIDNWKYGEGKFLLINIKKTDYFWCEIRHINERYVPHGRNMIHLNNLTEIRVDLLTLKEGKFKHKLTKGGYYTDVHEQYTVLEPKNGK